MTDSRITGNGLNLLGGGWMGTTGQQLFNATMLKAQRNFQTQNLFAKTLKTEMARFNNAGMNWPDGNFMDLFTFNLEKIHLAGDRVALGITLPGIFAAFPDCVKTGWFQPGVPSGNQTILLGNLSLKKMQLRALRGQRLERTGQFTSENGQLLGIILAKDAKNRVNRRITLRRSCKIGGDLGFIFQ